MAKKIVRSFTKMADDLLENPKTQVTAKKDLRIAPVHFVGHLYALWSGTKKFAEDGDLSRFDDDMIAELAGFNGNPTTFVAALQLRGWLDGKLIHDWIDHQRDWLISRYKNRPHILKAIWEKHGRVYGREESDEEDAGDDPPDAGKSSGSGREANGKSSGKIGNPKEVDVEEEVKALNPEAQTEKETKSPERGAGENTPAPDSRAPPGTLSFSDSGFRAQGCEPLSESSLKHVFDAFGMLFRFHGLFGITDFFNKVQHCKTSPATWAMVFLDKVHFAYKPGTDGKPRIDTEDVDPVALTVRGLVPKSGGSVHTPTEAARQFFGEIMVEHAKAEAGGRARWNGILTGPTIALELGRRKGKGKTS